VGKQVEAWHQGDGGWQMMYDIFNSNRPAAAPTPDDEAEVMEER